MSSARRGIRPATCPCSIDASTRSVMRIRSSRRRYVARQAIDHTIFHYKVDFSGSADVLNWIPGHGDNVSKSATLQHPKVISSQQLSRHAGSSFESTDRAQSAAHHGLKFKVAMAEGEHATICAEG